MGTNYYLMQKRPCLLCGRPYEPLHIGKSSAGWCFALHVTDEIKSLEDWIRLFRKGKIFDEYDRKITTKGMLKIIRERGRPIKTSKGLQELEDFCLENDCIPGPNGMARHRIDNHHCVGHGAGTWDLIRGEFD